MKQITFENEYTDLLSAVNTHGARYRLLAEKLCIPLDIVTKDNLLERSDKYEEMSEILFILATDYAKIAQHFRDTSYIVAAANKDNDIE